MTSKVDDDQVAPGTVVRATMTRVRRDAVDDPVGSHLPGLVHQQRHARDGGPVHH
jgi:hypothetical protein